MTRIIIREINSYFLPLYEGSNKLKKRFFSLLCLISSSLFIIFIFNNILTNLWGINQLINKSSKLVVGDSC